MLTLSVCKWLTASVPLHLSFLACSILTFIFHPPPPPPPPCSLFPPILWHPEPDSALQYQTHCVTYFYLLSPATAALTYITLTQCLLLLLLDCWCLSLVFILLTWFMLEWCTQKCRLNVFIHWYTCVLWHVPIWLCSALLRHLTSNAHCNEWHTHCCSRTRQLILITEQWRTTIITIICLPERRSKCCSFYSGPVFSVYCSCQLKRLCPNGGWIFFSSWVFVRVGVCVGEDVLSDQSHKGMLSRVEYSNRVFSLFKEVFSFFCRCCCCFFYVCYSCDVFLWHPLRFC